MNGIRSAVAVAVTVLATSACVTANTGADTVDAPARGREAPGMINVANNHWSDIIVYAESGSNRVRLGRVGSMRTAKFPRPRAFVSNGQTVNLVARPLGAQTGYSTGPIPLHPGQDLQLNLENNLRISNWAVWLR